MMTNNAFDPLNMSEIRDFVVVPEYLHGRYSQCVADVYNWHGDMLRDAFSQYAEQFADFDRTIECQFVYSAERELGFWIPANPDALSVCVNSNMYENPEMDRATFGMANTLLIVNHFGWQLADGAEPDTVKYREAKMLGDLYLNLRDWAFELSDQKLIDGAAVCGFLD